MKKEAIDMEDVLERVQDDRELLMELLDIFEQDYADKRKQMDGLIEHNDFEQIKAIAHSIKGAAGNISAKAMQDSCGRMEQSAEERNITAIAETMELLDKQFVELRAHISRLKEAPEKS